MMKHASILALLASASLSLAACDGGDSGSGSSGVDSSKTLDEVTAEEAADFCAWGESLFSETAAHELSCIFGALLFSEDEASCQMAYEGCLAEEPAKEESSCTFGDETLPACASMVTVAQVEECAKAQAANVEALAASLSCSSDPAELEDITELPPACAEIESVCPELFEDDEQQ